MANYFLIIFIQILYKIVVILAFMEIIPLAASMLFIYYVYYGMCIISLTIYNIYNYIYIYVINRWYGISYVLACLIRLMTWPFLLAVQKYYYV